MGVALTEFTDTHQEWNEGDVNIVAPYYIQAPHDDEVSQEQLSGKSDESGERQDSM